MTIEEQISEQFQRVWSGCNDRRDTFYLASELGRHFPLQIDTIMPKIMALFDGMGLPVPGREAFMAATAGVVTFIDDYGLTIRIESQKHWTGTHIAEHPLMLAPILERELTKGIILKICPGINTLNSISNGQIYGEQSNTLRAIMKKQGVDFRDNQLSNIGILPNSDTMVVLDQMAARHFNDPVALLKRISSRLVHGEQTKIYSKLRQAARRAWPKSKAMPDADGLKSFSQLVEQSKKEGVLVAGWTESDENKRIYGADKANMATQAGRVYAKQIKQRQGTPA